MKLTQQERKKKPEGGRKRKEKTWQNRNIKAKGIRENLQTCALNESEECLYAEACPLPT
jgi:hypothetical protein